ncbi:MAG: hypothetical protein HKO02_01165 [Hyphomonadaceae bacterium]|nr:hypothetical protein [Hyphomonadaceae bacterium]
MVVKTAIALLLTASLAGGVVYFGTQDDGAQTGEIALNDHPHKKVVDSEQSSQNNDETLSQGITDDETSEVSDENDNVINRLLGRTDDQEDQDQSVAEAITDETSAIINEIEPEAAQDQTSEQFEPALDPELESVDPETEIQSNNGRLLNDSNFGGLKNKSELVELVQKQILKIDSPEIKDQAYFDLVLYAVENGMYSTAMNAVLSIEKKEYRDSARGEYALGLIEDGRVEEAFKALEQIETENLKDVLQLKAVQALIGLNNPTP